MPLYEYVCIDEKCNTQFERLQKFSDLPPHCPMCGGEVEKQISTGTGFCLMGYGWDRPGMSVGKK